MNINYNKLQLQKEALSNAIINGTEGQAFKVYNLECGTGKTLEAEKSIVELISNSDDNVLFVRQFNKDGIESAKRINELAKAKGFSSDVALALNGDTHTFKELKEKRAALVNYRVIIITHARYKSMCVNKSNNKYIMENRKTLIIDEFINVCQEVAFSNKVLENIQNMLGSNIYLISQLLTATNDLIQLSCIDEGRKIIKLEAEQQRRGKKELNKLKKLINENIKRPQLKELGIKKYELIGQIDKIKQFYVNDSFLLENKYLYTYDSRIGFWNLENNIILDATANLSPFYSLNTEKFNIISQDHVLNHSKWSFRVQKVNSTQSGKEKYVENEFYNIINSELEFIGKEKTLVIGNKNDEGLQDKELEKCSDALNIRPELLVKDTEKFYINVKRENINHFGNVIGRNNWRELDNVLLCHTPNIPLHTIIIEFIYFGGKLDNRNQLNGSITGSGVEKVFRYNNSKLESFRQKRVAVDMYQAIKRVNRDMSKDTVVSILCNDMELVQKVINQFKGLENIEYITPEINIKPNKMDLYNQRRKEESCSVKIENYLLELKENPVQELFRNVNKNNRTVIMEDCYSKKVIREQLGLNYNTFRNAINEDGFIAFCEENNIGIEKYYFEIKVSDNYLLEM